MKVISGKWKGQTILGLPNSKTRPTMDRVKESLFAMIQEDIQDSTLLDLFSGSGNLAIEALSQGARFAYCNDRDKKAGQIIRKNIEKFSLEEDIHFLNLDFKKCLQILHEQKQTFDIIFLDPPYQTPYIKESLQYIDQFHLLNSKGKIICETDQLEKVPIKNWNVWKEKKYGDKYIVILEKI